MPVCTVGCAVRPPLLPHCSRILLQIEICISATGLAKLDVGSSSDPMAVLFEKLPTGLHELGRTEVICKLCCDMLCYSSILYQYTYDIVVLRFGAAWWLRFILPF